MMDRAVDFNEVNITLLDKQQRKTLKEVAFPSTSCLKSRKDKNGKV